MTTIRGLTKAVGRWRLLAALALAATLGLVMIAAAQTDQASKPARMALDEDLMKLAVVVMANQTPITQADAQAVLPALEGIQAQLSQGQADGTPPDDSALAALCSELQDALSPELQSAVGVVRLLTPSAPPGSDARHRGPAGPGAGLEPPAGPPPDGPGRGRRGGGGRGPGGMMGHGMLDALVDFFGSAAAG
jgi:hypothetical protein